MSTRTLRVRRGLRAGLPSTAAPGELLFAYDTRELFGANNNGDVVRICDIFVGQSAPIHPSLNQLWLDISGSINQRFRRWTGTQWVNALYADTRLAEIINNNTIAAHTTWGSEKINTELNTKSDAGHSHTTVDVTDFEQEVLNIVMDLRGDNSGLAPLDANGLVPLMHLPKEVKETVVVEDIPARNAIEDKYESLIVYVIDAAADATVNSGGAMYIYASTGWVKIAETESLDVVLEWSNIQNIPVPIQNTTVAFTTDWTTTINAKADKLASGTYVTGNLAQITSNGSYSDSGHKWSDLDVIDGGGF